MDKLGDPVDDRVMKNVPPIAAIPLTYDELFTTKSKYKLPDQFTFIKTVWEFQISMYLENIYLERVIWIKMNFWR
mgnify:CR=1 FL=1